MSTPSPLVPDSDSPAQRVAPLIDAARDAMATFAGANQERVDDAVRALAWSLYQPAHARALAELAVRDTGLGNVEDKVTKNQRKTFGTLRDLLRAASVGVVGEDRARGLVMYAKPVGVVAAVTPSTNPAATPVNKAMMAVKGRNAIVVAPSPAGYETTARTVELMRDGLERTGAPADLVQILPAPVDKALTHALMHVADLVVVTGSQNNVRAAYSSGTPAIGVGAGNVPVIVDESADLADAAAKITRSKTFDNATSCSSENALVILDAVYDATIAALRAEGAYLCSPAEREALEATLWKGGKLNRAVIAKDNAVLAAEAGLPAAAREARYLLVEDDRPGRDRPFSDEKLSLVLTLYRVPDLRAALECVRGVLAVKGAGHSCGIHTGDVERAHEVARTLDVVRVLVNQAHTFGNGGGFDSGLNFTLSMGCGTWGGNSISENLSYRHFLNITHVSTQIPEDRPGEEDLFGPLWERYGR